MSVLIKGMGMPKNCHECFYFASGCRCSKHNKGRPSDCPLIELPPHGDLISRQNAIKVVDDIDTFCGGWRSYAIEQIRQLPTIIEEEDEQ